MLRSSIITIYIILFLISPIKAQKVNDECKIEAALVEVVYKRVKVTDTLAVETDYKVDYLTLCAGREASAFYSATLKSTDSISVRNFQYMYAMMKDKDAFRQHSELEREVLFKGYPAGKITNHTRYSLCSWVYVEEWEKPAWEVTDSVKTIGSYECVLAVADYRGRRWYAWFTPEIPIQEGPWKLCGLPGLILEARDEKGHYSYEAQTVTLNPNKQVEYFNYDDRMKTDRLTSLKQKRKSLQESVKNTILSSGAFGISPDVKPDKIDKSRPLPHRNYDFEETDYPHE